jgi:isoprene-epoxide---glutathione S-transferase
MIELYGACPGFGLPDISPCVMKVFMYLTITKTPFTWKAQNWASMATDAPYGKLPYIIDTDNDNKRVPDSSIIIEYIESQYGTSLDKKLSTEQRAVATAFERLIGENLYWSGLATSRYLSDSGWDMVCDDPLCTSHD